MQKEKCSYNAPNDFDNHLGIKNSPGDRCSQRSLFVSPTKLIPK